MRWLKRLLWLFLVLALLGGGFAAYRYVPAVREKAGLAVAAVRDKMRSLPLVGKLLFPAPEPVEAAAPDPPGAAEAELAEREKAVAEREKALAEREKSLQAGQADLARKERDLKQREAALQTAQAALEQQKAEAEKALAAQAAAPDPAMVRLAATFAAMKPASIVATFDGMEDDMVLSILRLLEPDMVAKVLSLMDPYRTARLVERMHPAPPGSP